MSFQFFDQDYFETIRSFTPCSCGGNPLSGTCRAPGMCNASGSVSQRARAPEEIVRIKAEKQRVHEEAVLVEADAIRARRYQG